MQIFFLPSHLVRPGGGDCGAQAWEAFRYLCSELLQPAVTLLQQRVSPGGVGTLQRGQETETDNQLSAISSTPGDSSDTPGKSPFQLGHPGSRAVLSHPPWSTLQNKQTATVLSYRIWEWLVKHQGEKIAGNAKRKCYKKSPRGYLRNGNWWDEGRLDKKLVFHNESVILTMCISNSDQNLK